MHNALARANHVSALTTTVLMALAVLISLTTFILPSSVEPGSLLKISNVNVLMGRSQHERRGKEREFAFAKFDIMTDLSPLFHWNTKQVFVYLVADYSTPAHPQNSVVLWDRIVRSRKYAKINIQDGKQKYEFKEISSTFRNVTAQFSLQYNIHPHLGALTHGEIVRTEPVVFPKVQRKGVQ